MDTKALKKQMGAAIAMVLVAAIALGSATFAWFVSNNKVDATSSKISAQSNAAFMYIRDEKENSKDLRTDDSSVADTQLYPAHWVTPAEAAAEDGNYNGKTASSFYTAFGTSADANGYEMDKESLQQVVATGKTAGSVEAAFDGKYAVKNTFYVGSKGANLSNLKVEKCSIKSDETGNANFDDALRVLVKCGENWVLCDKSQILAASQDGNKLAETVSAQEQTIEFYVFYDGDATEIYTNNLNQLNTASKRINVVFTADSTTTDKTVSSSSN